MAFGQDRRRSNRRAFIATSLDPPHIRTGDAVCRIAYIHFRLVPNIFPISEFA